MQVGVRDDSGGELLRIGEMCWTFAVLLGR